MLPAQHIRKAVNAEQEGLTGVVAAVQMSNPASAVSTADGSTVGSGHYNSTIWKAIERDQREQSALMDEEERVHSSSRSVSVVGPVEVETADTHRVSQDISPRHVVSTVDEAEGEGEPKWETVKL